MSAQTKHILAIATCLLVFTSFSAAQDSCKIKTRIGADGTLYYYIKPVTFYYTSKKKLDGGIITDKENYFLTLEPYPFIAKKSSEKLTDSLGITLSNNQRYRLENYTVLLLRKEDTLLRMSYLIPKKILNDFKNYDVLSVRINMKDTAGVREYNFKLHKSALRQHLACFENAKKD